MMIQILIGWFKFKTVERNPDMVKLLKQIKVISSEVDSALPPHEASNTAKHDFYSYEQGDVDVATHVRNVKTLYDMVIHHKGEVDHNRNCRKGKLESIKGSSVRKGKEEDAWFDYIKVIQIQGGV
mmetsp:Transcript_15799/g.22479  ORF Transcript_15799/g.22479 Transcript_15799/m.22479 type:complete len:125 (-) Transcript_15799:990-1364(-)